MAEPEAGVQRAAALLERLLAEPEFRAQFRRDPAGVSEAFGLPELGRQITTGERGLETLEIRESRSSLAGVVAALAAEAVGVFEVLAHVSHEPNDLAAQAMNRAMTRLKLTAQPGTPGVFPISDPSAAGAHAPPAHAHLPASYWAADRRARPDVLASVAADAHHNPAVAETARALLADPHFSAWDSAKRDLRDNVADPRIVAILGRLASHDDIGVSVIKSGHSKFVAGTDRISNHFYGRAVDIAIVDGRPVSPSNAAARRIVEELVAIRGNLAPSEIGSPWDLPGPISWTNAAHQNHIHIGFDSPPPANLSVAHDAASPAPSGAGAGPAGADAVAVADPGAGRAVSGVFAAVGAPRGAAAGTVGVLAALAARRAPAVGAQPLDVAGPGGGYPGDSVSPVAFAAWMSARARAAGLPGELPVMAALVESHLSNANHGDRDSLGFFQMRTSIWDRGAYRGFPHDPNLQIRWFITEAESVRQSWIAGGRGDPAGDSSRWGEWIADVERPAAQYRYRYQLQLDSARSLVHAAEGHGGQSGAEQAHAMAAVDAAAAPGSSRAQRAVDLALSFRGTPYVYGGESPAGFDCSGLAQYVYDRVGVHLPRVAADQFRVGTPIPRDRLQSGDLVFFADSSGYVHHVGVSLGGDRFVAAPHTGDVVKVSSLDEPYYAQQFAGGRRVAGPSSPDGAAVPAITPSAAADAAPGAGAAVSGVFAAVGAHAPNAPGTIGVLAAVADHRAPAASGLADLATASPAGAYPGNGAPKTALAAWLAANARARRLPGELPVMAAVVESSLANLNGGDRDSVGFFQMRTSIWDHGQYAGYLQRPELQIKWFADQAARVRSQWIADGRGDPATEPDRWGEWIADIEQPATQYRGRYQPMLAEAEQLLHGSSNSPTAGAADAASVGPLHSPIGGFPAAVDPVPGATGSRLDQGFDATGSTFLSPWAGKVVYSQQSDPGWDGGGYVAIQSTEMPDKVYYLAEGISPRVQVGDTVTAGEVIASPRVNPYNGIVGNVEFGLADPNLPGRPLAQALGADAAQVVDHFAAWIEHLGGPTPSSTSDAGHG